MEQPVVDNERSMPFLDHLTELRKRLIVCIVAVAAGFVISYAFSEQIFQIIVSPVRQGLPEGSTLIFIGVTEAFMTYIKVAFISGITISMPVILYEIWFFVAPGLYAYEKKYVLPFMIVSLLSFAGGLFFCYFLVLPPAAKYLLSGYSSEFVKAMPTMREALSLSVILLFAFGLTFELPLVMLLLGRFGFINSKMLSKYRKYAVVVIFVAAAIITPTSDAITLFLMAGPLWILYELGLLLVWLFGKKKQPEVPHE